MADFVRIRAENGREVSVSRAFAENTPGIEILDAPALNGRGLPLKESRAGGRKPKPKTTIKKEAAKKAASGNSAPSEPGENTDGGVAVDPAQEA